MKLSEYFIHSAKRKVNYAQIGMRQDEEWRVKEI